MNPSNDSVSDDNEIHVLPEDIVYLNDNRLSHDLIDELRWNKQPNCPRCQSKYTKQVNTNVFRQLYRCVDCGYMFNSLSGTIFHGAKMPVYKYFHFFILHNALGDKLPLRDLSYALDISHRTASLLMKRASELRYGFQFAFIDRSIPRRASSGSAEGGSHESGAFFSYCDIKSVVVNERRLRRYLEILAKGEQNMVHGD